MLMNVFMWEAQQLHYQKEWVITELVAKAEIANSMKWCKILSCDNKTSEEFTSR